MKITVAAAAAIMGCSEQFIRIGLQRGQLDIGDAVQMSNRWTYNIAPAKLAARQGMTVQELEREIKSRKALAC
ncbi:MAG: hypothetical protein IJV59_09525 [Eubacterium sp.]|nr:hypothetical protein [Eubacterium sp.]